MWVVRIVLKLLLNLVAKKIISERKPIKNSTTNNTKGKEKQVEPNHRVAKYGISGTPLYVGK
jgi:hypothetical protein